MAIASGVVVPLVARGQTMGALGLFNDEERGPHTSAEIGTAVEIGRRAGVALHQARLYGQQRDLADVLQRSMLTEPPQPDHCEIVVRHLPATAAAAVGGDSWPAAAGDVRRAAGPAGGTHAHRRHRLVAVRLHPHDRPRPPEAGPNRVPDRA